MKIQKRKYAINPLCKIIPKEDLERVFNQEYCDINMEFLGFTDIYKYLSKIIPKNFTVIDLGCAYNPQCYYFIKHKEFIAVDMHVKERFKVDNCRLFNKSIKEFIKEDLNQFDLDEVFAICSYVPDWDSGTKNLIRNTFVNLFIFYPSDKNNKIFNLQKH